MEYPKISSDCGYGSAGSKSRRRRSRQRKGGCGRSDMPKQNKFAAAGSALVAGGGGEVVVTRPARNKAAAKNCGGGGGGGDGGGELTYLDEQHDPPNTKSGKERATKWDHQFPNMEACQFHRNVMKNRQVATTSVAYDLQTELSRARNRVRDLETERHLFKKKLNHFRRGVAREMDAKMRRKSEKMALIVDELKSDLERERKNHQRVKVRNDKLMSDLNDARLSNKKIEGEFEEEKRAREFLENVCGELGKDIQVHKENIADLKAECARIQEEAEEERKMMQMAEIWREERVQMKLVDARLILEEKCSQMNSLIADLETLLKSNEDVEELCYSSNPSNGNKISSSHRRISRQGDPHIARAMRGCIEWPCGIRRNGVVRPSFHEDVPLSRGS